MENVVGACSRRKILTSPLGRIDISGSVLKDGAFELIVKDSGISISEQDSEKVLQKLSQTVQVSSGHRRYRSWLIHF